MLEVKLARPEILMQTNFSPANTIILAEGAFMLTIGYKPSFEVFVHYLAVGGFAWAAGLASGEATIWTRVCCKTRESSRLLETSRRLQWSRRSMARISSPWL